MVTPYAQGVLELRDDALTELVAHCLRAQPHEGCGLLVGNPELGVVAEVVPASNAAASALRYEVDPRDHLEAERAASSAGLEVIGAFHSHTHTDAWPSPTDVERAVDPAWHWVIVSLRRPDPVVRSFLIRAGEVTEEPVVLVGSKQV